MAWVLFMVATQFAVAVAEYPSEQACIDASAASVGVYGGEVIARGGLPGSAFVCIPKPEGE